jgi:hypothetical protein
MITVLVEGSGDKLAVPELVRRNSGRPSVRCVDMQGKSNMVRRHRGFEDTVRRRYAQGDRSFIVLMDGDVTFEPYSSLHEEQEDMPCRAADLEEELGAPVRVLWSILEMESWLIGGIQPGSTYCGLRRVGRAPGNTEAQPQDPKSWLETRLHDSDYRPKTQECLARNIDLSEAKRRNDSMRIFFDSMR